MSLMEIKELLSENTGTLLAIVAITMTLVEIGYFRKRATRNT